MAQTQMAQTGIAANPIVQQQAALAQSLAETQAMQGAVAQAAHQQSQLLAHQLHQVGQATAQNTQLVAMAGPGEPAPHGAAGDAGFGTDG